MSGTMEYTASTEPRYIGHRNLTEDDLRYNEELDRIIQNQNLRAHRTTVSKKSTLNVDAGRMI